jgi:nucleotide-binding universal stress UspA family protein
VKPTRKRRYTRILAAVDPSRAKPEEGALNRKILEIGSSLAAHDKGDFHVVHAWKLFGESLLRGGGRVPPADVEGELRASRARHQRQLEELLETAGVKTEPGRVHLIKGTPDIVIPDLLGKTKTDVLVMGTLSRTGISRLLIGNAAENILSQVDCSVLTVKPDGFVTPVSLASGD